MRIQLERKLKTSLKTRWIFAKIVMVSLFLMAVEVDADIPLQIKETLGIARDGEMVHNGIPVARDEGWTSTDNLIVEDASGIQVPATFEVLSRWAGGKDDAGQPIQWLLVSFPVSVDANGSDNYHVRQGTPIERTSRVTVQDNSDNYTIDTGAAQFVLSKNSMTFFDSIAGGGQVLAADNGGSYSTIQGQSEATANSPLNTHIERSNDHYAVIKVEGDYANTPIGASPNDAPISYKVRYEFFAGSPTVIVHHKFFWAGSGSGSSNGRPSGSNYITMDNVSLSMPDVPNFSSADVYADPVTFLTSSTPQAASIAQRRKNLFSDPHRAELTNGSDIADTEFAARPMLINRSDNGAIAVSIDHMKYFEPQSITTDAAGKIKINVMAQPQYFADYQGTWARLGISALPQAASYDDTVRLNFAPLNQRLFAFPTNAYTAGSGVFREIAVQAGASSDQRLQDYYGKIQGITNTTRTFLESEGFHGLMVWGGLPRYDNASEVGTGTQWDKIYSTGNLTDFHSTWNNVVYQLAQEGDPSILYDLSFMGARRMLHTQIIQPSINPPASNDFMGWGYAGYDRYRSDGNSCHSYFDNLFNYYYLTGDMEVIDVLKVGGENQRDNYTRESGNLNDPLTEGADWSAHQGRIGSQFTRVFHFLGHVDPVASHASDSQSFLQDYHHMFRHIFGRSLMIQNDQDSRPEYAFYGDDLESGEVFVSDTEAEQNWMVSLYALNDLYGYYSEWDDQAVTWYDADIGSERNLLPSEVYTAMVNSFKQYLPTACAGTVCSSGDGTWYGDWPNKVGVDFSGHRLDGTITAVYPVFDGDPVLYNAGKSLIVPHFMRAGKLANNAELFDFGIEGLDRVLAHESFIEADDTLWEKTNGVLFYNLHAAISYIQGLLIVTENLPRAYQGTSYSTQLLASQGASPYTWTLTAGSLPEGLSLSGEGTISGTPTEEGTYRFTIRVTDTADATTTADLSLSVASPLSDDDDSGSGGSGGSSGCFITSINDKGHNS